MEAQIIDIRTYLEREDKPSARDGFWPARVPVRFWTADRQFIGEADTWLTIVRSPAGHQILHGQTGLGDFPLDLGVYRVTIGEGFSLDVVVKTGSRLPGGGVSAEFAGYVNTRSGELSG